MNDMYVSYENFYSTVLGLFKKKKLYLCFSIVCKNDPVLWVYNRKKLYSCQTYVSYIS